VITIPVVPLAGPASGRRPRPGPSVPRPAGDDALTLAREYARCGFRWLQASRGSGPGPSDATLLEDIVRECDAEIQLGGVQDTSEARSFLDIGVSRLVAGAGSVHNLLGDLAAEFPDSVVAALGLRDGRTVSHGGHAARDRDPVDAVRELDDLPLAGVLLESADLEDSIRDLQVVEDVVESSRFPVLVSGGIRTLRTLRGLEDRGVSAAIVGTALQDGSLNAWAVAWEFSA
jgi:phosphoribosylformimino-5-aminoimidazole carboxamide ribonucleotide (ProFAR) isomerase